MFRITRICWQFPQKCPNRSQSIYHLFINFKGKCLDIHKLDCLIRLQILPNVVKTIREIKGIKLAQESVLPCENLQLTFFYKDINLWSLNLTMNICTTAKEEIPRIVYIIFYMWKRSHTCDRVESLQAFLASCNAQRKSEYSHWPMKDFSLLSHCIVWFLHIHIRNQKTNQKINNKNCLYMCA